MPSINVPVTNQIPTQNEISEKKDISTNNGITVKNTSQEFQIGDIVTFNETINNSGVTMELTIPDGEIIDIEGNKYIIRYIINRKNVKTTKTASEIQRTNQ